MKTVIFSINGGIGKHIAGTAVVENISKHFPDRKIIVLAYYPEIYLNNPFVYRVYRSNSLQYFYEDFIKGKDAMILSNEVYQSTQYVVQDKHLIPSWCECLNLKYDNENPNIFLNNAELIDIKQKFVKNNKPIMILQANGGGNDNQLYSWARDIPLFLTQEIINDLKDKYQIYLIKKPNQISFNGAEPVSFNNIREALSLLAISDKRLLIDSFLQHASAALRMRSTVCWVATSPTKLGYSINNNIVASTDASIFSHTIDSILLEKDFLGLPHQCNLDIYKIFKKNDVLKEILN